MTSFTVGTGNKVKNKENNNRFKTCYVDADTILYRSATFAQEDYVEVLHKVSGRTKEFKNITSFRGRSVKTEGGWLKETNDRLRELDKKTYSLDDFTITNKSRLHPDFENVEEAIKNSLDAIGFVIGDIKKFMDSDEYRLVISAGQGNYRDHEAKTVGYKSSRGEKPLFFAEVREAFIDQYKSKIIETVYAEAEDTLGWIANLEQAKFGDDFDKWESCISFIDKDVEMVYAPSFNYDKLDQGWRYPTRLECAKCLVAQSISGDPTDTIEGIPTLTEEVTKMFGLRKANGCGKATAEKLISDCTSEREMWERACFAYQSYYGVDEIYNFKDVHGEEQEWTWKNYLQQTYILVKMQDFEGQVDNLFTHLDYLGINYQEKLFQDKNIRDVSIEGVESVVKGIKEELSSYKTLTKPKLLDKISSIVKYIERLENELSLIK